MFSDSKEQRFNMELALHAIVCEVEHVTRHQRQLQHSDKALLHYCQQQLDSLLKANETH